MHALALRAQHTKRLCIFHLALCEWFSGSAKLHRPSHPVKHPAPSVPRGKYICSLAASTSALWQQGHQYPESLVIRLNLQRSLYGDGAEGMSLIRLQNCTKCSVSGGGILNGQAQQWVTVHWPTRKLTRYLIRHNCYCCAAALCIDLIGRGCACVLFVLRPTCLLIRLCNRDVAAQELERPWLLPCAIRVPSQSDQGRRRIRGTDEKHGNISLARHSNNGIGVRQCQLHLRKNATWTRLSERRRPCKASSWWMRRTGRSTSSGAATLRCPM